MEETTTKEHPEFDFKLMYKTLHPYTPSFKPFFAIKDDQITQEPEKVKQLIEEHFQKLYTPPSHTPSINPYLSALPKIPNPLTLEFQAYQVKEFLTSKKNTAPGIDNITYAHFKFLAKNRKNTVFEIINRIYEKCYKLQIIPKQWQEGSTILLPKTDPHLSLDNWRPITLLTTLYKGYTFLINEYIHQLNIKVVFIPKNQFDFRKKSSTTIPINILRDFIDTHEEKVVVYIDFKKAFDSINHQALLKICHHIKFSIPLIQTLSQILSTSVTTLQTAFGNTDIVKLNAGVKQGDLLSFTLFAIAILVISWNLKLGSAEHWNHLLYADDLALLAFTHKMAKNQLDLLRDIIETLDLQMNLKKCAVMYSGLPTEEYLIPTLTKDETYKYLRAQINIKSSTTLLLKLLQTASFLTRNILKKPYLNTTQKIKLINTTVIPKILYFIQFHYDKKTLTDLDIAITQQLNQNIKLPQIFPGNYWTQHRQLKHLPTIALQQTINTIIRSLNYTETTFLWFNICLFDVIQ